MQPMLATLMRFHLISSAVGASDRQFALVGYVQNQLIRDSRYAAKVTSSNGNFHDGNSTARVNYHAIIILFRSFRAVNRDRRSFPLKVKIVEGMGEDSRAIFRKSPGVGRWSVTSLLSGTAA